MAKKGRQGDWQQTGFRADRDLLNKFRAQLADKGLDMGPVIEGFIISYVNGTPLSETTMMAVDSLPAFRRAQPDNSGGKTTPRKRTELRIVEGTLEILRTGGEPAELLRRTVMSLLRMARLQSSESSEDGYGADMVIGINTQDESADDELRAS